jgi:tetratricopeptide (TPR) repeat protein
LGLVAAGYLVFVFPRWSIRMALFGSVLPAALALCISAIYFFAVPISCGARIDAMSGDNLDASISDLSKCLTAPRLPTAGRVEALHARAWAYQLSRNYTAAIDDTEAALKLQSSASPVVLTRYAMYLRRAGRFDDSLRILEQAQRRDVDGKIAARVEYHKGLVLDALGRHEEAAKAFNEVLKTTPSTLSDCSYRALMYKKLGRETYASSDFDKCVKLIGQARSVTDALPIYDAGTTDAHAGTVR